MKISVEDVTSKTSSEDFTPFVGRSLSGCILNTLEKDSLIPQLNYDSKTIKPRKNLTLEFAKNDSFFNRDVSKPIIFND